MLSGALVPGLTSPTVLVILLNAFEMQWLHECFVFSVPAERLPSTTRSNKQW